jgi:hypothetical protein
MPMMAMTISSSISVKARVVRDRMLAERIT